jgi:uncharacterized protein
MWTFHPAKVLHIYANSTDQWSGRPLHSAIIHKCLDLGIAGATAFRSFEGYGLSHEMHTTRLLSLSENLPVRIEIVDSPEAVERLLDELGDMLKQTLVTIGDIQLVRKGA